jgi:hypothetical protein
MALAGVYTRVSSSDEATTRLIAVVFAGISVVSTVVYYIFRYKELKTLREIRDRLGRPGS